MEKRWGWRVVDKHFYGWVISDVVVVSGDEIAGNTERRKRKETKHQGRRGREGNKIRKI